MENTTIHSGDDVQRPTHSVSNGTVTRDQPTYTNLKDNRESVLVNFSLLNIQGFVTKYTNKLLSTELTQIFQNNDIILLTETWSGELTDISVNGFNVFQLDRGNKKLNTKRNS